MEGGSEILVIILIILALLLSFAIGGNDETPAPFSAAGILNT
jgi:phosphate/sulfate permease